MKLSGAKFHQHLRRLNTETDAHLFPDFKIETYGKTEIQTWTDIQNRPRLRVYVGVSGKPVANYYYHNSEARAEAIQRHKDNDDKVSEWKAKKKTERAKVENKYKIGDILYSSWGYGQTNIDFYKVVGVTEKSVKVIQIGSKAISTECSLSEYVVPNPEFEFGEVMMRRVGKYGISINSVQSADLWGGTPKLQTHYH